MQTSLWGISNKAKLDRKHRFRGLFSMLGSLFLLNSFRFLNKKAAPGVDHIDAKEYRKNLWSNIQSLVKRVKDKCYHAKLVLRRYIPKGKDKLRPLGMPATEDKLLQTAVSRILTAIYEHDFLPCSYGYRPKRGAKDAVKDLTSTIDFGRFGYIVEADIKGFFDNIDHGKLLEMLSYRIDDKPFLGIIRKWLKAGVLETDGKVIHPLAGTPQGGIVSPVLANIYLHNVLDLWFHEVVIPHCDGEVYLCRYADDFVCAFQYKRDAEKFYRVLGKRLGKYGLELAAEKTRIISFSRFRKEEGTSFEFLGFEFRWGKNRAGKDKIQRRTSRKKLWKSVETFNTWIKSSRNMKLKDLFRTLNAKLRGYTNYYGIIGNFESLELFFYHARTLLFKWLNRRSQRQSYNWQGFNELLKHYKFEKPRIVEKWQPRKAILV